MADQMNADQYQLPEQYRADPDLRSFFLWLLEFVAQYQMRYEWHVTMKDHDEDAEAWSTFLDFPETGSPGDQSSHDQAQQRRRREIARDVFVEVLMCASAPSLLDRACSQECASQSHDAPASKPQTGNPPLVQDVPRAWITLLDVLRDDRALRSLLQFTGGYRDS